MGYLIKLSTDRTMRGTEAGQKAMKMDAADGKVDGQISANVWNDYAKTHGGKPIKESIDIVTAMNSITAYAVREQAKANQVKSSQESEAAPETEQ